MSIPALMKLAHSGTIYPALAASGIRHLSGLNRAGPELRRSIGVTSLD